MFKMKTTGVVYEAIDKSSGKKHILVPVHIDSTSGKRHCCWVSNNGFDTYETINQEQIVKDFFKTRTRPDLQHVLKFIQKIKDKFLGLAEYKYDFINKLDILIFMYLHEHGVFK